MRDWCRVRACVSVCVCVCTMYITWLNRFNHSGCTKPISLGPFFVVCHISTGCCFELHSSHYATRNSENANSTSVQLNDLVQGTDSSPVVNLPIAIRNK